jgi:hypothetical protein
MMPAYNFQERWADDVEAGRKRQTIRPKRKHPTQVGDMLYLYTGMRTKRCRKLRETECLSVEPIEIHPQYIKLNGIIFNMAGMRDLAHADGFDGLGDFYDFFRARYGVPHDVELELIRW